MPSVATWIKQLPAKPQADTATPDESTRSTAVSQPIVPAIPQMEIVNITTESIEVGSTTYCVREVLGKGVYGKVVKASFNGSDYAIKIQSLETAKKETENLIRVKGITNTSQLFQYGADGDKGIIVTDFVGRNNLSTIVKNRRPEVIIQKHETMTSNTDDLSGAQRIDPADSIFTEDQHNHLFTIEDEKSMPPHDKIETIDIMIPLLEAISSIHDQGLVHRDIKPQNIIWNSTTKQLQLIDFGVSCNIDTKSTCGTPAYMDNYAFNGIAKPQSDYHEFVVTAHELLTGFRPSTLDKSNIIAIALASENFNTDCKNTETDIENAPIFECLLNDVVSKIDELPNNPELREAVVKKLNHIKSKLESEESVKNFV